MDPELLLRPVVRPGFLRGAVGLCGSDLGDLLGTRVRHVAGLRLPHHQRDRRTPGILATWSAPPPRTRHDGTTLAHHDASETQPIAQRRREPPCRARKRGRSARSPIRQRRAASPAAAASHCSRSWARPWARCVAIGDRDGSRGFTRPGRLECWWWAWCSGSSSSRWASTACLAHQRLRHAIRWMRVADRAIGGSMTGPGPRGALGGQPPPAPHPQRHA